MSTNDNDSAQPAPLATPDAHGRAALLLVESLIHGLCESATLTTSQAVDIAERAADVQSDQAKTADGAGPRMWAAHALLSAIASSLRTDDRRGPQPPQPVS